MWGIWLKEEEWRGAEGEAEAEKKGWRCKWQILPQVLKWFFILPNQSPTSIHSLAPTPTPEFQCQYLHLESQVNISTMLTHLCMAPPIPSSCCFSTWWFLCDSLASSLTPPTTCLTVLAQSLRKLHFFLLPTSQAHIRLIMKSNQVTPETTFCVL